VTNKAYFGEQEELVTANRSRVSIQVKQYEHTK